MKVLAVLAVAAAVTASAPQDDKPLTAYERLVRTCDLARTVWHFYGDTRDKVLRDDLEMLLNSACDLPKHSN